LENVPPSLWSPLRGEGLGVAACAIRYLPRLSDPGYFTGALTLLTELVPGSKMTAAELASELSLYNAGKQLRAIVRQSRPALFLEAGTEDDLLLRLATERGSGVNRPVLNMAAALAREGMASCAPALSSENDVYVRVRKLLSVRRWRSSQLSQFCVNFIVEAGRSWELRRTRAGALCLLCRRYL
jgi:hypothetical protein